MTPQPEPGEEPAAELALPALAPFGSAVARDLRRRDFDLLGLRVLTSVIAAFLVFSSRGLAGVLLAACGLVALSFAGSLLRRRTSVIGADGVGARLLGRHRFVSYGRIESIDVPSTRRRRKRLVLRLRDGSTWTLRCLDDPEATAALIRRARDAFDARPPSALPAEIARGEDDLDGWVARIERAAVRPDYRVSRPPTDQLVRVAADPSAHPDARVAAALATSLAGTARDRLKVRAAAGRSANAGLRVALEEAAEGRLSDRSLEKARRLHRG